MPFPTQRRSLVTGKDRPPNQNTALAQEILDTAFHQAKKISSSGKRPLERAHSLTLRKIGRSSSVMLRHLGRRRKPFRQKDSIPPFTLGLLESRLGKGKLERSLRRLKVAEDRIIKFRAEEERKIPELLDPEMIRSSLRRFYGRASSAVKEVEEDLARLDEAALMLRRTPHIDAGMPTVVVIGYPNVGKSSLIGLLSSASPKVASYPFTTLSVTVGHAAITRAGKAQMVDTPGILDRDPHSTKETTAIRAQREAIAAIESSTGMVLFLLDPTGTCGWPLPEQLELLDTLRKRFGGRDFLVVENKSDLLRTESANVKISCTTGEGLEGLTQILEGMLAKSVPSWEVLYPTSSGIE